MAIGNAAIEVLVKLRTAGYLKPGTSVVEIGAQQLGSTFLSVPDRVAYLGSLFGIDRPPPFAGQSGEAGSDQDWAILTAPFARDFWHWLGFRYAAIDIDGSPDSIPLDLNFDTVPPEAKGKFDLVTNFGTTEHVSNQLNAFNVIHDLTAPNGIMVHEVPAQGMFNHGIVNYNFKFFWLLMRSNGYKFIHADFMPAEDYSAFPDNVEEFLNTGELTKTHRPHDYKAIDAGWLVIMRKSFDMDFVPPIDVNTGTPTEIDELKKRYWTVFEPERFDDWQKSAAPAQHEKRETAQPSQIPPTPMPGAAADENASTPLHSPPPPGNWIGSVVMKPLQIIRRMAWNSDSTAHDMRRMIESSHAIAQGVANQSDLIERKLNEMIAGIGNQTDLIRRKLDALNRVMHELREVQKAQLAMQRQAAEMFRQLPTDTPGDA